jgi:hypothetical protein
MNLVIFAGGLFAAALLIHWLIWRLRRPQRVAATLLLIFFSTLGAGLLLAPHLPWLDRFAPTELWPILHVCLFHSACTMAYMITYSALEQDSPTLTIIAYVAAAPGLGRSRADLLTLVSDQQIVGARFEALCASGLITPGSQVGAYVLTMKGRRWALLFSGFRRLYRLQKGG